MLALMAFKRTRYGATKFLKDTTNSNFEQLSINAKTCLPQTQMELPTLMSDYSEQMVKR